MIAQGVFAARPSGQQAFSQKIKLGYAPVHRKRLAVVGERFDEAPTLPDVRQTCAQISQDAERGIEPAFGACPYLTRQRQRRALAGKGDAQRPACNHCR